MSSKLSHIDRDMRVLIVDDFVTMRRIVRTIFESIGFHKIEEAEDGKRALEKLQSNSFGLVVSDWNMPNMMGIDLLRAVRADPKLANLPFLMVTAESQKENVMEAVKAGVSNYVIKPFNAVIMEEKLLAIFKP